MFVHGKKDGIDKLVDGFLETIKNDVAPPKTQIKKKILEIAERKRAGEAITIPSNNNNINNGETKEGKSSTQGLYGTARWVVHNEIATKLELEVSLNYFSDYYYYLSNIINIIDF